MVHSASSKNWFELNFIQWYVIWIVDSSGPVIWVTIYPTKHWMFWITNYICESVHVRNIKIDFLLLKFESWFFLAQIIEGIQIANHDSKTWFVIGILNRQNMICTSDLCLFLIHSTVNFLIRKSYSFILPNDCFE